MKFKEFEIVKDTRTSDNPGLNEANRKLSLTDIQGVNGTGTPDL